MEIGYPREKIQMITGGIEMNWILAAACLGSAGESVAYVEKNDSGIIPYLSDAYEIDGEAGGIPLGKM